VAALFLWMQTSLYLHPHFKITRPSDFFKLYQEALSFVISDLDYGVTQGGMPTAEGGLMDSEMEGRQGQGVKGAYVQ
jgi:hypothetical protein